MITIPTGTNASIRIPAKAEKPGRKQSDYIERIGVSVKRAAEMLDLCERTIWTLIKDGKIRSIKVGMRTIVSVQSLRELIDGKEKPRDSMESSVESQG